MSKVKAFLGIDPSTASSGYGVIGLGGELLDWGVIAPDKNKLNEAECAAYQYRLMESVLDTYDILGMACEDQFNGRNPDTFKKLSRVTGYVVLLAGLYDIPIKLFAPSAWRKLTHGDGSVNKKFTQQWVNETYDQKFLVKHNDITDGIGISYATRQYFQGENTDGENQVQTG